MAKPTLQCTLSELLAHFEAHPDSYYLCEAAASMLAAKHLATTKKKKLPHTFPTMADSWHTFQQLRAVMPAYMAEARNGGSLTGWVRRMPSHLRAGYVPSGRIYRIKFLRWAIKKFNNPSITFEF